MTRSGFIRGGESQRNIRDEEFKAGEADDAKAHRRWSATLKSEVYGVSTLSNPYESASECHVSRCGRLPEGETKSAGGNQILSPRPI